MSGLRGLILICSKLRIPIEHYNVEAILSMTVFVQEKTYLKPVGTKCTLFLVKKNYFIYHNIKVGMVGQFTSFVGHYYCIDTSFLFYIVVG